MTECYIFKVDGVIKIMAVSDEVGDDFDLYALGIPQGVPYFIFNQSDLPTESAGSWELSDDGVISINQDKLLQLQRQSMSRLTPIEFDIKLNDAGLYDAVQELIKDNFNLRIAYNRATFFIRTDPFIDQARIALNLTDEQVDEMWMN